jgi:hypothetical protein
MSYLDCMECHLRVKTQFTPHKAFSIVLVDDSISSVSPRRAKKKKGKQQRIRVSPSLVAYACALPSLLVVFL